MGTITRRKLPDLVKNIVKSGEQYNFFQLMHLLEQHWLPCAISAKTINEHLQLIPCKDMGFPATDIKQCNIDKHHKITTHLTFLGLCGVDSPLPHYFSEYIHQEQINADCIYDFLNIFNNRLYILQYLAWKKYHLNNSYNEYLIALSGNILQNRDEQEFAFAGLLGAWHHNSTSLSGIISDYLGQVLVKIKQFMPRWINVGTTLQLGPDRICLGDNAILGNQALTTADKITIFIGPLEMSQTLALLPDQEQYQRLIQLISRYIGSNITFNITFITKTPKTCLILGQDNIKIGWISWLGEQDNDNIKIILFLIRNQHEKNSNYKSNGRRAFVIASRDACHRN